MSIKYIIEKNKYNNKGYNISLEMFQSFLEENSISKEIHCRNGVFDLYKGDKGQYVDKNYMNYFIHVISNKDNLSNILDHPCIFETTKGERLFVYHPYKPIDFLENPDYIQGFPLREWCQQRGLSYQAFQDSWYNPNSTIMVVIKVQNKKAFDKFILNNFEKELYHKENLFCPRSYKKPYQDPLYSDIVEKKESFYNWFIRTVLLVEKQGGSTLYPEIRNYLKHLSPFILSNIGFPKKEEDYNILFNYLTYLPIFSRESEYTIAFHYLYGIYTSLEYYYFKEGYEQEFDQDFEEKLSKDQFLFLEQIVDETRFL